MRARELPLDTTGPGTVKGTPRREHHAASKPLWVVPLVGTKTCKTEPGDKAPYLKENMGDGSRVKSESHATKASVRIDLVPYAGRKGDELLCKIFHLPEPGPEIADLLTCIVDVVDQGLVVGLELLRILVLVLFNIRLDVEDQIDSLVLIIMRQKL